VRRDVSDASQYDKRPTGCNIQLISPLTLTIENNPVKTPFANGTRTTKLHQKGREANGAYCVF
jgi:hypothetical protein